ncbi:D-alanyl-D-alanine carboxypeptidase [Allorhizobium terrae]|uniref:D-alanyl-D-alanine carboxypeptidase n=1 Tax=Allorhizobium terrae TaxID=1848972 RepID=A0A4S3ZYI0_9HYPH|nr:D-alanyl-D-alanine carboxypeptidase [Allorhizobium terrae]THF50995.1 D-alanyl-D-alanine carboxypeptidase [Allorhizobium terrae]TWD55214.1 D-alanyl-D-alanine carboxypeptidase (penicillin-binding protein 5/6) [Agrobacterium vitis]
MNRILVALLMFLSMSAIATPASAGGAQFLLDARTGRVLFSENADVLNHPASLTKMMTIYMAFDAIRRGTLSWDSPVPFSKHAARQHPTKLRLKEGDQITVREAILSMITLSANDSAAALAEKMGGTEEGFAAMMTAKARQLGMPNTTFVNASGLPDTRQITTARDMSTLAVALLRDFPREYHLFATRSFNFRGRTINGHNNLMYRLKGIDGIKTGYTDASGFNLVSAYSDGNRRVIGVVMGGRTAASRDNLMAKLITSNLSKAQEGNALIASATPTAPIVIAQASGNIPKPVDRSETITVADADAPILGSRFGNAYAGGTSNSAAAATEAMITGSVARTAHPRPLKPIPLTRDGEWQIQIAAAPSAEKAMSLLQSIRDKIGGPLAERDIYTEAYTHNGSTVYRARFTGFPNKDEAQNACERLVKSSYDCVLMPARG